MDWPTYNGKRLSWSIGSQLTTDDQRAGYPATKTIIRAFRDHRPEQLAREKHVLLRASFDRMFGHNAQTLLSLIKEVEQEVS